MTTRNAVREPRRASDPSRGASRPRQARSVQHSPGNQASGRRLIGYVRVSTREQGNGHGLDAQRGLIERYCKANGHRLLTVIPDVMSTRSVDKMHGRNAAVAAIEAGLADGMVIATLDRATRSTLDGAVLLNQARTNGWRLLSVDGVDSDDERQALLTDIRIAVAAEERRKISERTRQGLEAARAKGTRLGRPSTITPTLARKIVRLRTRDGLSAQRIAAHLTARKVPTPGGGAQWHHSTVRAVLVREGAA